MDTGIKKLFAPLMGIALAALGIQAASASATNAAHCYRLDFPDSPAREEHPHPQSEVWCYEAVREPAGATYIYNADGPAVKPELAMILYADGTLKHGSLMAGKVTYYKAQSKVFNPFALPLREPHQLAAAFPPPASLEPSRASTLQLLLTSKAAEPSSQLSQFGLMSASTAYLPWRGYWWPYKGLPMLAPMRKFDAYAGIRIASNPGIAGWEATYHRYHGIWWEGHCNGWASAAILRPEPRYPRVDSASGAVFSVSDQKGLLSEIDYCGNAKMFGRRGGGINISPDLFHKTLQYYIGYLHKPVVENVDPGRAINNHIITGYAMNVQGGPHVRFVKIVLTLRAYDNKIIDAPGIAPPYTREYRYALRLDENGNAVGGYWISKAPGFLWVPLSTGRNCRQNNPNLKAEWVNAFMGGG